MLGLFSPQFVGGQAIFQVQFVQEAPAPVVGYLAVLGESYFGTQAVFRNQFVLPTVPEVPEDPDPPVEPDLPDVPIKFAIRKLSSGKLRICNGKLLLTHTQR